MAHKASEPTGFGRFIAWATTAKSLIHESLVCFLMVFMVS